MKQSFEPLKLTRLWQSLGWMLLAVVTGLSLTPELPSVPQVLGWDKSQHLLAYAALMYWFGMAFYRRWHWPVFLLAWGLLMELIQGWGGIRTMDPYDMIANGLGVVVGLGLLQTRCALLLAAMEKAVPWYLGANTLR